MSDAPLTVYVCDAIMGSGKTSAAINMMNKTPGRYVFVTQFLSEVERICHSCGFVQPVENIGNKIVSIQNLLRNHENIASTHALFYHYTEETMQAIRDGHYTLVLDEVIDVVKLLEVSQSDIALMLDGDLINVDPETKRVEWVRNSYDGKLNDYRAEIESGYVTYENGRFMVWTLPIELFTSFDRVYILTYLFQAQYQYYYFLSRKVNIRYIDVKLVDSIYQFFDDNFDLPVKHCIPDLKDKIHILDDTRVNAIGNSYFALSSNWYRKITDTQALELKNNIYNVMHNIYHTSVNNILWSVYKHGFEKIKRKGYMGAFLTYNARAMNNYGDRHYLAYCVNVFPDPEDVSYFKNQGYGFDEDGLALSCLIQWIWRSAIRNGDDIWIYIPSKRMRNLLMNWINSVCEVN